MSDTVYIDDEELDIEPYEGEPDFDRPQESPDGVQDDDPEDAVALLADNQIVGFVRRIADPVRTWKEATAWYRKNTTAHEIGFDPDNMCLKVCRTARNIPAKHLTAKIAQDNTPLEHRVYKVEDLRAGMVAYSDDPSDSNTAGHIYTILGRRKGFTKSDKAGVLTVTNSVKANELVVVSLDYYERYWGDDFKFGATELNGVVLDVPGQNESKVEKFQDGGPVYDLKLLAQAGKDRPKPKMVLDRIETQIKRLPDNPKLARVRAFKDGWRADREIDLTLLNEAVKEGRVGVVKQVRDEIRRLIETLPDE